MSAEVGPRTTPPADADADAAADALVWGEVLELEEDDDNNSPF